MTVYTDGVHLVADTLDELHKFAQAMGLKREWFQNHRRHPHYDLTTKRAVSRVILKGAVCVDAEKIVEVAHKLAGERVRDVRGGCYEQNNG